MDPTIDVFEKRIAALEGGVAALATSSGFDNASAHSEKEQLSSGVLPGVLRVSVGIENIADIKADLDNAFSII